MDKYHVLLTLVAVFGCISFVSSQSIGVVRCYVCKSNIMIGVRNFANCTDIYNTTTTTIKYCRACLKYSGNALINHNNIQKGFISRACFDENSYNLNNTGIFQQSGLVEPTPSFFNITDGMSVMGKVLGYNLPNLYLIYGPGDLSVCNDGDLCNSAVRQGQTALTAAVFPVVYYILKLIF